MQNGMLPSTIGSEKYKTYDEFDIATGDYMSRFDLAKYKYHIDLGGGGGTTWTGTLEKLAMPGLLFHHVTPTKDYFHDRLVPWVHYVPVAPDLSDVKEKFDWAESHPEEAKGISDQATAFMQSLGTDEGFAQMFEEEFTEPIRRAMDAYSPVSVASPGKSWEDMLEEGGMIPAMTCTGYSNNPASCRSTGDGDV